MIPTFDVTKIRNLKVIAKLKVGQKLSTRYQFYSIVSTDSYFIAPKRWFSGESRHNTVDSIQPLVMSCITQPGLSIEDTRGLAEQLSNARDGLVNLQATYIDDQSIYSGLEVIIEMIDRYTKKHRMMTIRETPDYLKMSSSKFRLELIRKQDLGSDGFMSPDSTCCGVGVKLRIEKLTPKDCAPLERHITLLRT